MSQASTTNWPRRPEFQAAAKWVGWLAIATGIIGAIGAFPVFWAKDAATIDSLVELQRIRNAAELADPKWTAAGRFQLEGEHAVRIEEVSGRFWSLWAVHCFAAVGICSAVICCGTVTIHTFSDCK